MSEIKRCWNEDHRYMLTPSFLLNLIVTYRWFTNAIYILLRQNLGIGRSILLPLRETEKTAEDQNCMSNVSLH